MLLLLQRATLWLLLVSNAAASYMFGCCSCRVMLLCYAVCVQGALLFCITTNPTLTLLASFTVLRLHYASAGANLANEVLLTLDDYTTANPKVLGIQIDAAGVKNDGKKAVLAPLYVFRRGNIPDIVAYAKTKPHPYKQIQGFLKHQMAKTQIYAISHDIYFTAKRLDDFLLTDNFFKHYAKVGSGSAALR